MVHLRLEHAALIQTMTSAAVEVVEMVEIIREQSCKCSRVGKSGKLISLAGLFIGSVHFFFFHPASKTKPLTKHVDLKGNK